MPSFFLAEVVLPHLSLFVTINDVLKLLFSSTCTFVSSSLVVSTGLFVSEDYHFRFTFSDIHLTTCHFSSRYNFLSIIL